LRCDAGEGSWVYCGENTPKNRSAGTKTKTKPHGKSDTTEATQYFGHVVRGSAGELALMGMEGAMLGTMQAKGCSKETVAG